MAVMNLSGCFQICQAGSPDPLQFHLLQSETVVAGVVRHRGSTGRVAGTTAASQADLAVTWSNGAVARYQWGIDTAGQLAGGTYTDQSGTGATATLTSAATSNHFAAVAAHRLNLNGGFLVVQGDGLPLTFQLQQVGRSVTGVVAGGPLVGMVTGTASDLATALVVTWQDGQEGEYHWTIDGSAAGHLTGAITVNRQNIDDTSPFTSTANFAPSAGAAPINLNGSFVIQPQDAVPLTFHLQQFPGPAGGAHQVTGVVIEGEIGALAPSGRVTGTATDLAAALTVTWTGTGATSAYHFAIAGAGAAHPGQLTSGVATDPQARQGSAPLASSANFAPQVAGHPMNLNGHFRLGQIGPAAGRSLLFDLRQTGATVTGTVASGGLIGDVTGKASALAAALLVTRRDSGEQAEYYWSIENTGRFPGRLQGGVTINRANPALVEILTSGAKFT